MPRTVVVYEFDPETATRHEVGRAALDARGVAHLTGFAFGRGLYKGTEDQLYHYRMEGIRAYDGERRYVLPRDGARFLDVLLQTYRGGYTFAVELTTP